MHQLSSALRYVMPVEDDRGWGPEAARQTYLHVLHPVLTFFDPFLPEPAGLLEELGIPLVSKPTTDKNSIVCVPPERTPRLLGGPLVMCPRTLGCEVMNQALTCGLVVVRQYRGVIKAPSLPLHLLTGLCNMLAIPEIETASRGVSRLGLRSACGFRALPQCKLGAGAGYLLAMLTAASMNLGEHGRGVRRYGRGTALIHCVTHTKFPCSQRSMLSHRHSWARYTTYVDSLTDKRGP